MKKNLSLPPLYGEFLDYCTEKGLITNPSGFVLSALQSLISSNQLFKEEFQFFQQQFSNQTKLNRTNLKPVGAMKE